MYGVSVALFTWLCVSSFDVVHAVSHHCPLRIRFCDDSDQIGRQVQFGFVTRKCCRVSFGLQFIYSVSRCLLQTLMMVLEFELLLFTEWIFTLRP